MPVTGDNLMVGCFPDGRRDAVLRMLASEAARRHGGRIAIVAGQRRLSFAELDQISDAVAAGLAHRGVLPGDVVAIALPFIPEYAVCSLAVAKLGAIAAGYDLRLPPASLARLHEVVRPALTVAAADLSLGGEVIEIEPSSDGGGALAALARAEPPPPPLPPDRHRPVLIVTAGSAQAPRGAIFGDSQLETIRQTETGLRWGGGEPVLLDAAHTEFLTRLPCVLQSGATTYCGWSVPPPEEEVRATAELELPVLAGTPDRLAAMLAHPLLSQLDFPKLREVLVVGAAPGPILGQALRERFEVPVRTRYLPVEAGLGVATRRGGPPEDAETTVGRPAPGVTLAIRDSDGRAISAGGTGEVLLRSAAVMSGYWDDPAATARTITKDGFVRTGDLGWVDKEGRLHLVPPRDQ